MKVIFVGNGTFFTVNIFMLFLQKNAELCEIELTDSESEDEMNEKKEVEKNERNKARLAELLKAAEKQ